MPIVTDIKALYRRTIQPKDYESATAEVAMSVALEDGDEPSVVALTTLRECQSLTLKALKGRLGKGVAEVQTTEAAKDKVDEEKAQAEEKAPAKKAAAKKTGRQISDTPEDRGEAEEGENDIELPEEEPKPKRKRAPAKKKETSVELPDDEFPEDSEGEGEGEGEGEEDTGVSYDPSELEGGGEDDDEVISATDLQAYMASNVSDKNISVEKAKSVMFAEGDGAGRVADIPVGLRNAVYKATVEVVEAKIAAKKK